VSVADNNIGTPSEDVLAKLVSIGCIEQVTGFPPFADGVLVPSLDVTTVEMAYDDANETYNMWLADDRVIMTDSSGAVYLVPQ
jgi:hypothetical protein